MIDEFEHKGVWWFPGTPGSRISGTLTFSRRDGAILDLMGSLKEIQDMNKTLQPEIILGVSSTGKNISLHECFETRSTLSIPGFQTSSFYANTVFVGAHFQGRDNMQFKKISIHYSHLDEWVNISGFDIQHFFDRKEVVIKYTLPESIQANIDDNYKIFIDIRATGPGHSIVQKEASVKQKTYITVEFSEEKSFHECLDIMHHIQNFLSLGVMEPVFPLTIEGITDLNKQIIKDKTYYPPVEIYYSLPDIPKASKILAPFDMLFTFKEVSNRFEPLLKTWLKKADLLKPFYDLYFAILYNPRIYLEHRFLNLIQAIESFHQRIHGGEYLSHKEYKHVYNALLNAIPDGVNENLRESLQNRLKYGNEFSLRERLKDVFDKYQEVLNQLMENKKVFIRKVIDTRNYQTHHDEDLRKRAAAGEELYHLTQELKMLVEICLLAELGFTSEEIRNLFSRNRKYQQRSAE